MRGIQPTAAREERFMTILVRNCSKEDFDLRDTGIGERAGCVIARVLQGSTHYTSLNLAGNTIRNEGAIAIAELLKKNQKITSIDLRSNDIGVEGGCALFKALDEDGNRTLTSLDLSGMSGINRNHIGKPGAEAVESTLKANKVLQRLAFRENGFGVEGALAVANGLKFNNTVTHLDLGSNSIGPEGARHLADAVMISEIAHLYLSRNNIGDTGAIAIAELLVSSRRIQTLDISVNKVSSAGGKHLGDALRENTTLTALFLEHNELGSVGLRSIAEGLRENSTLQMLSLSYNKIEARGAQELADAIKNNKGLTSLDMSGNIIGDEGATAFGITGNIGGCDFATNLQYNSTLQHLNMKNNSMQEKTGEVLANFLKSNNTLLSLDITFNDFNYKHISILEKKIKDNLKNYKAAAVDRYRKEINALHANQSKLMETEQRLQTERVAREREEEKVREKVKQLESAEQDERDKVKELKENIAEHMTLISKTEAKQISLTHEAAKIRADKEARYWSLVQKLHKEKDSNLRLEKRLKSKRQQIDELKAKYDKEIGSREEQLRIIMFDRNAAENDAKAVEQQVEKLKNVLEEVTIEYAVVESAPTKNDRTGGSPTKNATKFPSIKSR